jgi:ABC-type uncharacterized transport system involved in gliding motility auxiliary subunit
LSTINFATAGHFSAAEGSSLELEQLVTSSRSATTIAASRFSFLPDPSTLQNGFVPSGTEYVLAARLTGVLPSAFPDGKPPMSVSSEGGDANNANANAGSNENHLSESSEPANVIVVADVDVLGDQLWVQVQSFFGQQIANAFASNGAFLVNALDSLAGSSDLISVRSRESYSRPFTRVEELRVEAEAQFSATEQRLQSELAETERRLSELQSSREDSGNMLMTPEQQQEIDRFIEQRSSIRKEMRAEQRVLDQDIERLGTVLKGIKTGLVPLLLAGIVLFAVWRLNRTTP